MRNFFDLLFANFWVTFALMLLCSIADLVGLTAYSKEATEMVKNIITDSGTKSLNIGLGFILTLFYFIGWIIYKIKKPKK